MTLKKFTQQTIRLMAALPYDVTAFLGRFSIAAVFWKSGQTKLDGFKLDIVEGTWMFGMPRLAESTVDLFREEYKLPVLPPEMAAVLATAAEHILPALLLLGLATRFAALGLLVMTLVIQLLVYPSAYPVHGVWAFVLLILMAQGPGRASADHVLFGRR